MIGASIRLSVRGARALLFASIGLVLSASSSTAPPPAAVETAADWERAFSRSDGWTGGDGLGAVALPGGRMLWLFGDSWIGPVRDGKHETGSAMINNAIAVHPIDPDGDAPSAESMSFLWGTNSDDGKPLAWIVPPPEECANEKNLRYWPTGGAVVVPDGNDTSALYVFLIRIRDKAGDSDGTWNFEGCGSAVARIENPQDDPSAWRVRQTTLTRLSSRPAPGTRLVSWGASAALASGEDMPSQMVLVFGVDATDGFNKKLLLARAPAASVDQFETWSFRTASAWSSDANDATPVAYAVMDEFSINRVTGRDGPRWVMIYSKPILDDHIVARVATRPEGPWSEMREIHRCPEPSRDARLFAYSAKAHPEVSGAGRLLISYCVNSQDFSHMASNAWIYQPKFVHAPLEQILDGR